MKFHQYKKARNSDVENWLKESIPDLSPYCKHKITENEIIRDAPYDFFELQEPVTNFWFRLTIVFIPIVFIVLFALLPVFFLFSGKWGYSTKYIQWYYDWLGKING
jgi:hypothetical protein